MSVRPWYREDWAFIITVLQVGQENDPTKCRLGLEVGDSFHCTYGTPAHFCPTTFLKIFPAMEAIRSGGDLRNLGGTGPHETVVKCPAGVVKFRLRGQRVAE